MRNFKLTTMKNKTAIIIGSGISGPAMAMFLKRIGITANIYEAQPNNRNDVGVFLGISPNGLNVIKELMPLEKILTEFTPGTMQFFNANGKNIGELDNNNHEALYGVKSVQIKRGNLNRAIRNAAIENGIEIEYNKKLKAITQTKNSVTAIFEDETSATADFLIGADGIHSATRKAIFSDASKITYTGQLGTGGFTTIKNPNQYFGSINMTFGKEAFFGYAISNKNEVWWFNNIDQPTEPNQLILNKKEQQELKAKLLALHKNDPLPITEIITNAEQISCYPIYDIPFLKQWHKGNVCLIGDAAHATAPHIGQGASLALEDTIVLAKCIRDIPNINDAFKMFQSLRQERAEHIVKSARKTGDTKMTKNPIKLFFRDTLLSFFIKQQGKKMEWVYKYKTNWNEKI